MDYFTTTDQYEAAYMYYKDNHRFPLPPPDFEGVTEAAGLHWFYFGNAPMRRQQRDQLMGEGVSDFELTKFRRSLRELKKLMHQKWNPSLPLFLLPVSVLEFYFLLVITYETPHQTRT